jgi:hypothetical protein
MDLEEKRGLWDNIHAKRERIKHGSGEHMRKPGSKGAPTAADFKNSQTKTESYFKTGETAEIQSTNPKHSSSRFDATNSAVNIYKNDTPGQTKNMVKKVIREVLESQCSCGGNCGCNKPKKTVGEATYQGKTVPLNKPMKGDVPGKKSKVYVDPDGDGKAKKVNFGDANMTIKKNIPARKRSYCARSSGQGNLTDKTSANYWSRRAWDC